MNYNKLVFNSTLTDSDDNSNLLNFSDLSNSKLCADAEGSPSAVPKQTASNIDQIQRSPGNSKHTAPNSIIFYPRYYADKNIEQTYVEQDSGSNMEHLEQNKTADLDIGASKVAELEQCKMRITQEQKLALVDAQPIDTFGQLEQSKIRITQLEQKLASANAQQIEALGQLEQSKVTITRLEQKLASLESEVDSFEQLEQKMILENFHIKKEHLKLQVRFNLISVGEACKELGCCSTEILQEFETA